MQFLLFLMCIMHAYFQYSSCESKRQFFFHTLSVLFWNNLYLFIIHQLLYIVIVILASIYQQFIVLFLSELVVYYINASFLTNLWCLSMKYRKEPQRRGLNGECNLSLIGFVRYMAKLPCHLSLLQHHQDSLLPLLQPQLIHRLCSLLHHLLQLPPAIFSSSLYHLVSPVTSEGVDSYGWSGNYT